MFQGGDNQDEIIGWHTGCMSAKRAGALVAKPDNDGVKSGAEGKLGREGQGGTYFLTAWAHMLVLDCCKSEATQGLCIR